MKVYHCKGQIEINVIHMHPNACLYEVHPIFQFQKNT